MVTVHTVYTQYLQVWIGGGVIEYIGKAAVAWLIGFVPFLEIYLAVPAALVAGLDYFSAVFWSVLGNFTPVLLIAFIHDRLTRIERVNNWLTGKRSERFQRAIDRYGGPGIILITPWVGIWVVAATAQALGMKRSVLLGFSLVSIVLWAVVIAVLFALGIELYGMGAR